MYYWLTDDDREGDAIAWHCGKLMKLDFNKKIE